MSRHTYTSSMLTTFKALRHLGLIPAIFLGLLPCVPASNSALADTTHMGTADELVQIQICSTPGQVKFLVLNLTTGEMFEETLEQPGASQTHQKCGHSLCQGAGLMAVIVTDFTTEKTNLRQLAIVPNEITQEARAAVARAPPVKLPTSQWG